MDVRARLTADQVGELRRALYRRDPPDGAVDAYLAALDGMPEADAAPAPPPRPRRRRRRRRVRLLVVAATLAALVPLAVAVRDAPARSAAAPAPSTGAATAPDRFPTVPGDEIGAMSGGPAATKTFDAGGRPAVVSVFCDRSGTLALRIGDDPVTVLTCQVGMPALALVPSSGPLRAFAVAVVPDGPVRWTATVGALPATG